MSSEGAGGEREGGERDVLDAVVDAVLLDQPGTDGAPDVLFRDWDRRHAEETGKERVVDFEERKGRRQVIEDKHII